MHTEQNYIKDKFKKFTKITVLEIAYCSTLYLVFNVLLLHTDIIYLVYLTLLFTFPFFLNIYLFIRFKRKEDTIQTNNIVIIQILVLLYCIKFLIHYNNL